MTLSVDAKEIILIGQNGAGKSNFLEAIHYLCLGSSFRERTDDRLVSFHKNRYALRAKHAIDGHFDRLNIQYEDKKKSIYLNQAILRDRKELLIRYPCVIFGYHDIALVYGEPSLRRQFFDQVASLIYADSYILLLREYHHLLKQRNSALKSANKVFIKATEERFKAINWQIMVFRQDSLALFNNYFIDISKKILNKPLQFYYKKSLRGDSLEAISDYLDTKKHYEWQKKSVLFGVQRDQFILMDSEREIANYLSIGQKRMVSLLMKQVLLHLILDYGDRKPIILLDDVFVELDIHHKEAFWRALPEYEQLFMSGLPHDHIYLKGKIPKIYYIESGEISLRRNH